MKYLFKPTLDILDSKNIIRGVIIRETEDSIFLLFEKDCLSHSNIEILNLISSVYVDNMFYTNNIENDFSDRLYWWFPDGYDEKLSEISNKKYICFMLNKSIQNSKIMCIFLKLAQTLVCQDLINTQKYKNETIFSEDLINRSEKYYREGQEDNKYINITVSLDSKNVLLDNPYAQLYVSTNINTPSDTEHNIVSCIFSNVSSKVYKNFCLDDSDLNNAWINYFKDFILTDKKCIEKSKMYINS